jgi:hypothetical protein
VTTPHTFLSDSWIDAARAVSADYEHRLPPPPVPVRVNVVVTDLPWDQGRIEGHIDTHGGQVTIERGHLEGADLVVTLDWHTARAAFVTQDLQALFQAFFGGKILVEGDVSRLLALQAPPRDPAAAALAAELGQRIRAITAED